MSSLLGRARVLVKQWRMPEAGGLPYFFRMLRQIVPGVAAVDIRGSFAVRARSICGGRSVPDVAGKWSYNSRGRFRSPRPITLGCLEGWLAFRVVGVTSLARGGGSYGGVDPVGLRRGGVCVDFFGACAGAYGEEWWIPCGAAPREAWLASSRELVAFLFGRRGVDQSMGSSLADAFSWGFDLKSVELCSPPLYFRRAPDFYYSFVGKR